MILLLETFLDSAETVAEDMYRVLGRKIEAWMWVCSQASVLHCLLLQLVPINPCYVCLLKEIVAIAKDRSPSDQASLSLTLLQFQRCIWSEGVMPTMDSRLDASIVLERLAKDVTCQDYFGRESGSTIYLTPS